jgi:hypothetical protein
MNAQQVRNCFGWATTEAAFGCYAEILDHALRRYDTPPRSLNAIGKMYQPQVEFRLRVKPQVLEGREIGVIAAIARDRHGNPVQGALKASSNAVGNINQFGCICWLYKVFVTGIAIAEVVSQFNITWHLISQPHKLLNNPRFDRLVICDGNPF